MKKIRAFFRKWAEYASGDPLPVFPLSMDDVDDNYFTDGEPVLPNAGPAVERNQPGIDSVSQPNYPADLGTQVVNASPFARLIEISTLKGPEPQEYTLQPGESINTQCVDKEGRCIVQPPGAGVSYPSASGPFIFF
jgi:hypothetical protein